jgi:hypothetical protein
MVLEFLQYTSSFWRRYGLGQDGWLMGLSEALQSRFDGTHSNGKVCGRKDAAWAEVPPAAVFWISNDSGFIALQTLYQQGLVSFFIARTQNRNTGQRHFSESVNMSEHCFLWRYTSEYLDSDVHTRVVPTLGTALRLSAPGLMEISWDSNTA